MIMESLTKPVGGEIDRNMTLGKALKVLDGIVRQVPPRRKCFTCSALQPINV